MNNNKLILGVIIIILVIMGIWYYSSPSPVNTPVSTVPTTNVSANQTDTTPLTTPNTFKSIFTQSGNHQCSYEQISSSTRSSSVIYIADGKMRGEFRTTTINSSSANLMIYTGGYLYSWKEGATTGKKSSIKSIAELPQIIPTDLSSGAVFGASIDNVSWDCHDWLKYDKAFVTPAGMVFSV